MPELLLGVKITGKEQAVADAREVADAVVQAMRSINEGGAAGTDLVAQTRTQMTGVARVVESTQDEIQKNLYKTHKTSADEYRSYLQSRLEQTNKFSKEYRQVSEEMTRIGDAQARAAAQAARREQTEKAASWDAEWKGMTLAYRNAQDLNRQRAENEKSLTDTLAQEGRARVANEQEADRLIAEAKAQGARDARANAGITIRQARQPQEIIADHRAGIVRGITGELPMVGALGQYGGMQGILGSGALGMAGLAGAGMAASVEEASKFQKETVVDLAGNTTLADGELEKIKKDILDLGTDTGASFTQIGNGFRLTKDLSFDTADSFKIMDQAARAAVATGGDVNTMANVGASAMHEFHLKGDDAARTYNTLYTGSLLAKTSMEQFAANSGQAFGLAAAYGDKMTSAVTILAALTRNGLDAAEAQTQYKDALIRVTAPSEEVKKKLLALSEAYNAHHKDHLDLVHDFSLEGVQEKTMVGVIDDLSKAVGRHVEKIKDFIPAQRGAIGAIVLTRNGMKDLKDGLEATSATFEGRATPLVEKYAAAHDTLANRQDRVQRKFEELLITIGDKFLPIAEKGVDTVGKMADAFNKLDPETQESIISFVTWTGGISLGIGVAGKAVTALAALKTILTQTTVAQQAATTATKETAAAQEAGAAAAETEATAQAAAGTATAEAAASTTAASTASAGLATSLSAGGGIGLLALLADLAIAWTNVKKDIDAATDALHNFQAAKAGDGKAEAGYAAMAGTKPVTNADRVKELTGKRYQAQGALGNIQSELAYDQSVAAIKNSTDFYAQIYTDQDGNDRPKDVREKISLDPRKWYEDRIKQLQKDLVTEQATADGIEKQIQDLSRRPAELQKGNLSGVGHRVLRYQPIVDKYAKEYGVDPSILLAQMQQESGGNPNSVSGAGAVGLMQFMPQTAAQYGISDRRDPEQSIRGAAHMMADLIARYGGSVPLALAAYNAGPGRVKGSIPKIAETQHYVKNILAMAGHPGGADDAGALAAATGDGSPDSSIGVPGVGLDGQSSDAATDATIAQYEAEQKGAKKVHAGGLGPRDVRDLDHYLPGVDPEANSDRLRAFASDADTFRPKLDALTEALGKQIGAADAVKDGYKALGLQAQEAAGKAAIAANAVKNTNAAMLATIERTKAAMLADQGVVDRIDALLAKRRSGEALSGSETLELEKLLSKHRDYQDALSADTASWNKNKSVHQEAQLLYAQEEEKLGKLTEKLRFYMTIRDGVATPTGIQPAQPIAYNIDTNRSEYDYERGAISPEDRKADLEKQRDEYEQFSDEWVAISRQIDQLDMVIWMNHFHTLEEQFKAGKITLADYQTQLAALAAQIPQYTDQHHEVETALNGVDEKNLTDQYGALRTQYAGKRIDKDAYVAALQGLEAQVPQEMELHQQIALKISKLTAPPDILQGFEDDITNGAEKAGQTLMNGLLNPKDRRKMAQKAGQELKQEIADGFLKTAWADWVKPGVDNLVGLLMGHSHLGGNGQPKTGTPPIDGALSPAIAGALSPVAGALTGITPNNPIGKDTGINVGNATSILGQLFGPKAKGDHGVTATNPIPVYIVGQSGSGALSTSSVPGGASSIPGASNSIPGATGSDADGASGSSNSPLSMLMGKLGVGNNALKAGGLAAAGYGLYNAFHKKGKHGLFAKLGLLAGAAGGFMLGGPTGAEYGAGLGSWAGGQFDQPSNDADARRSSAMVLKSGFDFGRMAAGGAGDMLLGLTAQALGLGGDQSLGNPAFADAARRGLDFAYPQMRLGSPGAGIDAGEDAAATQAKVSVTGSAAEGGNIINHWYHPVKEADAARVAKVMARQGEQKRRNSVPAN